MGFSPRVTKSQTQLVTKKQQIEKEGRISGFYVYICIYIYVIHTYIYVIHTYILLSMIIILQYISNEQIIVTVEEYKLRKMELAAFLRERHQ